MAQSSGSTATQQFVRFGAIVLQNSAFLCGLGWSVSFDDPIVSAARLRELRHR
jgi:hypothetical protein